MRAWFLAAAVAASAVLAAHGEADPEGVAFLEANAAKPDVVSLESGLQYKVLQRGEGKFHPTVDSPCTCHYHGTLISGEVFDSSVDRDEPIDFAPNQVIRGWTEAMQLMVEGDKLELYIPSDLAYGDRGAPPSIPPGAALVFTIELLSINGNKVPAMRCDPTTLENCDEREAKYATKMRDTSAEEVAKQIERLTGMQGSKMKPDLADWLARRLQILKRITTFGTEDQATDKQEL
ncbi:Peptidyl-prolyl cis-trans isomerase [Hondaea fermentalgiana]|uniref:peptidylprolyl isomerase n=1 Tax=Hondaea fermentalgiana TaxID=2315210 RepID=A0A2R5G0M0_9STRA|nr:Peptidyl-prolyl cis-trans isomerase [Hondaea fermentalgiana]|eukprot:GBG23839.1 Peptidyl-prolyl cis-trans isomerase [Hondaea fermentalgiana]